MHFSLVGLLCTVPLHTEKCGFLAWGTHRDLSLRSGLSDEGWGLMLGFTGRV